MLEFDKVVYFFYPGIKQNGTKHIFQLCLEVAAEKGISEEKYRQIIKKRKKPKLPDVTGWEPKPVGYVPKTYTGEHSHTIQSSTR